MDTLSLKDVGVELLSVPMSLWNIGQEKQALFKLKRQYIKKSPDNPTSQLAKKDENTEPSFLNSSTVDCGNSVSLLRPFHSQTFSDSVSENNLVNVQNHSFLSCKVTEKHSLTLDTQQNLHSPCVVPDNKNKKKLKYSNSA